MNKKFNIYLSKDELYEGKRFNSVNPENNMHPIHQADWIAYTYRNFIAGFNEEYNLKTNSEAMVKTLASMVGHKKADHKVIHIHFTIGNDIKETIKFTDEDKLIDWPVGFFSSYGED